MDIQKHLVHCDKFVLKYLSIALVVIFSVFISIFSRTNLPKADICKRDSLNTFITSSNTICVDRARVLLNKFSRIGPKPIGSIANEETVPKMVLGELESIKAGIKSNFNLHIEQQNSTYYQYVDNIIARLSKNGTKSKSLLINSHFDTSRKGPGASDDGINVFLMLEVLRSLTTEHNLDMHYDIIFLFNDGEESGLLGSQLFVTHRWAKDVVAFINLEAMGSDGHAMLFQSTSNELMKSYIKSARHPFATIIGQEIFESGVISSDTDFKIFTEYLNVGGLDFAFIENGYVYHTKYDTSDIISDGCIALAGNNILKTVKDFIKVPKIENTGKKENQDLVYFDMWGLFMITYRWEGFGKVWSYFLSLLPFVIFLVDICICKKFGPISISEFSPVEERMAINVPIRASLLSLACLLVVMIVSALFTFMTAYLLGKMGHTMSWYSSYPYLFLLYSSPVIGFAHASLALMRIIIKDGSPIWNAIELFFFHTCNMFFGLISITTTALGKKSGYLFNISPFINNIWWMICQGTLRLLPRQLLFERIDHRILRIVLFTAYICFQIIQISIWSYVISTILIVFIPLTGRFMASENPDVMIGMITCFATLIISIYFLPLLVDSKYNLHLALFFMSIFVVAIVTLVISNAGFPYPYDPNTEATRKGFANWTSEQLDILYN